MKYKLQRTSFNCFQDVLSEIERDASNERLNKTDIINRILLSYYEKRLKNKNEGEQGHD